MSNHRNERVAQQLREELAVLIEAGLDDPRIGTVTVTDVQLSRDLRHARVFVSGLGTDLDREGTLRGLHSARGFLRRQLSARLSHLVRTPELTFAYDPSVESEMRVEELLSEIAEEQD